MSQEASGQATHRKPDGRAGAADPMPDDVVVQATRHARAAIALAASGDDVLARGARRVAVWLVLRLATTPPRTELEHDVALSGLEAFLPYLPEDHRAHVASLLQAASWAQAERRVGMGLRPYGSTPPSRRDGEGRVRPSEPMPASRPGRVPLDDLARYEAATATDVSSSLSAAICTLRNVLELSRLGSQTEYAWIAFEAAAIELCLDPAASLAGRLDARRVLLIVWRTARRRRPLIAAVLRRKLSLDRRRWPGSVLAEPWDA